MSDKEYRLEALLSHRPPMILLDEALDYNEESAWARLQIKPTSLYYDSSLGGVPAWVGIEYMAQTMGIWSGSQQLKHKRPIEIGFLLGARHYQCNQPVFPSGAQLIIESKVLFHSEDGLAAFECCIRGAEINIEASARINAFMPENSAEFIRRQS